MHLLCARAYRLSWFYRTCTSRSHRQFVAVLWFAPRPIFKHRRQPLLLFARRSLAAFPFSFRSVQSLNSRTLRATSFETVRARLTRWLLFFLFLFSLGIQCSSPRPSRCLTNHSPSFSPLLAFSVRLLQLQYVPYRASAGAW